MADIPYAEHQRVLNEIKQLLVPHGLILFSDGTGDYHIERNPVAPGLDAVIDAELSEHSSIMTDETDTQAAMGHKAHK